MICRIVSTLLLSAAFNFSIYAESSIPRPDHVVVVIMENHSFKGVIGQAAAPYINSLVPRGALLTNSFAITHPSEPNYMALFSGSTQGLSSNKCSVRFDKPNLGSELIDAGLTFTGYAEKMPSVGYTKCSAKGGYVSEHNPWVHFKNLDPNVNQPFTNFPTDFSQLSTVSIIVPVLTARAIANGDAFLKDHIDPYIQWAMNNNSLLILTFDEDDKRSGNHIPTLFIGPMVQPGQYAEKVNHYNVLRTLEDMYGLEPLGKSATASAITDIWTSSSRATPAPRQDAPPRFDHVVLVVEENQSFGSVIGNAKAPYINSLAAQGAVFTQSFQVGSPSLPNYVVLFSGSTQGLHDQKCSRKFNAPNLQTELSAVGLSFVGYAESLPSPGFTGCNKGAYVRKHNPWVHFTNFPPQFNQPFSNFPSDFSTLPTFSFIEPNMRSNSSVKVMDVWLKQNLDAYIQWAMTHNSLFILTFDEGSSDHHIPTIFVGANIKPGSYSEKINHYNVNRTITDMYGLAPLGKSANATPILDVWTNVVPASARNGEF